MLNEEIEHYGDSYPSIELDKIINKIKQFAVSDYLNEIPETVTYLTFEKMEELLNKEIDWLIDNDDLGDLIENERENLLEIGIDEYKKSIPGDIINELTNK